MPKVFIVCPSRDYVAMFEAQGWEVVNCISDADLVQFTGGEDVTSEYYGEEAHPTTYNNVLRDVHEMSIFAEVRGKNTPMAGICRGGQFLHVMNGGALFQNVDSHAIYGTHRAFTPMKGEVVQVTSTHHQMMRMNGCGEVLLFAEKCYFGKQYMHNGEVEEVDDEDDIESVYHAKNQCLCFQPHPEFGNGMEARGFYFRKIFELFGLTGDV